MVIVQSPFIFGRILNLFSSHQDCLMLSAGIHTPFVYVTRKALVLGNNKWEASMILVVFGLFNTASRVATGFVTDRPCIDAVMLHNFAGILMGISTALVAVLERYELLMAYAAFFGVFMG